MEKHNKIRCTAAGIMIAASTLSIGHMHFNDVYKTNIKNLQNQINAKQEIIEYKQNEYNQLENEYNDLQSSQKDLNTLLQDAKDGNHTMIYMGEFYCTSYCGEAYPHICNDGVNFGHTKSGAMAESNLTISVDPDVIPLGAVVYVEGLGVRIAQDTGGAISGKRLDIYFDTHQEALNNPNINRNVWILVENNN